MRPIIVIIVATLTFSAVFLIGVAVEEPVADQVKDKLPSDKHDRVDNILKATLQYSVPVFFFTLMAWGLFWYLRRERQTVRR